MIGNVLLVTSRGLQNFFEKLHCQAAAGDIVALAGVDCESGVTFTDGKAKITPGDPKKRAQRR